MLECPCGVGDESKVPIVRPLCYEHHAEVVQGAGYDTRSIVL